MTFVLIMLFVLVLLFVYSEVYARQGFTKGGKDFRHKKTPQAERLRGL